MTEICINKMLIMFASIQKCGNSTQTYCHDSTTPIVYEEIDLLEQPIKRLDTKCESFNYFVELFNKRIVEGQDLRQNFLRALKRRVRGTAEGIKIFFKDSEGIRQYMFIRFNYHYERDCWFY